MSKLLENHIFRDLCFLILIIINTIFFYFAKFGGEVILICFLSLIRRVISVWCRRGKNEAGVKQCDILG